MGREDANLLRLLHRRLSDRSDQALRAAVSLAERRNVDLYLVGGGVRDLLLGGEHVDLDLVVEGDAAALASDIATELWARLVSHPRFGTAVVQDDGFRLDVAQSRTERYERPGALPCVRPAGLQEDLGRRDFSINAMALRLVGPRAGQVVDPFGGREDLEQRRVRVLHDASFRDDATRILRGLRYAGRLRFRLQRHTGELLRRDLSYLDAIGGARLRHEFERLACEARVAEIVRLTDDAGALCAAHPALRAGARAIRAVKGLPQIATSHRDAALFCLLLAGASLGEAEGAIERLALTGRQAGAVRGFLELRGQEARLGRASLRASAAARLLAGQPRAAIEALALATEQPLAADRARRYLDEWRFVRPRLNGRDVEALGVPHGPQVGAAMVSLRDARLDGRTKDREDEMALVRRMTHRGRVTTGARHG